MPSITEIQQLRKLCGKDIEQTLPDFADLANLRTKTGAVSVMKARRFILDTPPAIVIPRRGLTEFTGRNPGILSLKRTLATDAEVAKSPLNGSWTPIRWGRIGNEGLAQIDADLQTYAPAYARAVFRLFKAVTSDPAGYSGFIDALERNGYKVEDVNQTLSDISKTRQDLGLGHIEQAADIGINYKSDSPPLLTEQQMYEYIADYFPNGLRENIYPEYNANRATTTALARINKNNAAEVRFILTRGLELSDIFRTHEYAHIFYGIQAAREGKIPSVIASTGPSETFAKVISGINQGEALFFASCMEAALEFTSLADKILQSGLSEDIKIKELTEAIKNPSSLLTRRSGFIPVSSSTVVPFGPFSIAYFYDVVNSISIRRKIEKIGTKSPLNIYSLVA